MLTILRKRLKKYCEKRLNSLKLKFSWVAFWKKPITWEEIILEGLRIGKDTSAILLKAAEVAPPEITSILSVPPEDMLCVENPLETFNIDRKEAIIRLFWYYQILTDEKLLRRVHFTSQLDIPEIETTASIASAMLAHIMKEKEIEADFLFRAGDALYDLRRFSEAEEAYNKVLNLYRELIKTNPAHIPHEAMVLNSLGLLYKDTGHFAQAEKMCGEALTRYRELEQVYPRTYCSSVVMALNNVGLIYCETDRFSLAEGAYREALEKCSQLTENPLQDYSSTLLNNLGLVYHNTEQFTQAEEVFVRALTIRRELASSDNTYTADVADTLNNLGNLYRDMKKVAQAEKAYKEASNIFRELAKDNTLMFSPKYGMVLNSMGNLYQETDRFSQAETMYRKALKIGRDLIHIDDTYCVDVINTLNNLGNMYYQARRFSDAEEAYSESLTLYQTLRGILDDFEPSRAEIMNLLGNTYLETHKFTQAEYFLNESLNAYRKLAEKNSEYEKDVAKILNNIGVLYFDNKEYSRAEHFCIEALKIYKKIAQPNSIDRVDVAMCLHNMGNLYYHTYQFSQAEKAYARALTIRRKLASSDNTYAADVADTLNNLGNLYYDLGKSSEAEKAYTRALTIRRKLASSDNTYAADVAETLSNLGNLYYYTEEYQKAEEKYRETLKMYNELAKANPDTHMLDVAMVLNNMGNFYYETGNLSKAEEKYRDALTIFKKSAEKSPGAYEPLAAGASNNLGLLYYKANEFEKALAAFNEALAIRKRRNLWFELAETYLSLSLLLGEKADEAVRSLELGILFSREKKYTYAQKGKEEGIYLNLLEETENIYRISGILEALRDPGILSLKWNFRELEKVRSAISADMLLQQGVPPLYSRVQLPDDLLFLYIQHTRNGILYFTHTNEGKKVFRRGYEFAHSAYKLLVNLRVQALGGIFKRDIRVIVLRFNTLLDEWADTLPGDVLRLLSEKDTIVFSPDAASSYFPLEGLPIDGEPLCLCRKVVRATSINQLQEPESTKLITGSSLVVGNPWPSTAPHEHALIYPHPSRIGPITFLEGAKKEAETLADALPHSNLLVHSEATALRFMEEVPHHTFIHFAGHGYLGRVLFFSGPMTRFPPEFEPDEFSEFRKAWRSSHGKTVTMMDEWDPVTDLDILEISLKKGAFVFLSACETGKHEYAGGGHFQGLAQAFLKKGASNVVSSLIPLYDTPARDFALTFYDNLLSSHSVINAMRKTRERAKKRYEAPIYWLPYIHYSSQIGA